MVQQLIPQGHPEHPRNELVVQSVGDHSKSERLGSNITVLIDVKELHVPSREEETSKSRKV